MNAEKLFKTALGIIIIACMVAPFVVTARAACTDCVDWNDVSAYPTTDLFITGNYTLRPNTALKLMSASSLPDNFLGYDAKGHPVFSFSVKLSPTVVEDTDELIVSEQFDYYGYTVEDYDFGDVFLDDATYLVENNTEIAAGETYHYEPTSAFSLSTYPYLWVKSIYSSTSGTNTTIKINDGTANVTLLNDYLGNIGQYWYDLSEETTATTVTNITIEHAVTKGVYVFGLGARTIRDTRHVTCLLGVTSYSSSMLAQSDQYRKIGDKIYRVYESLGSSPTSPYIEPHGSVLDKFRGKVAEILQIPPLIVKMDGEIVKTVPPKICQRITGWGGADELEESMKEAILYVQDWGTATYPTVDDITDYNVDTAEIISTMPPPVQHMMHTCLEDNAGGTSSLPDFIHEAVEDVLAGSQIFIDNPTDEPPPFWEDYPNWAKPISPFEWVKENAEEAIDLTHLAIGGIIESATPIGWGMDVVNEIIFPASPSPKGLTADSAGQLKEAPTVLLSISGKLCQVAGFVRQNWIWFTLGGSLVVLVAVVAVVIVKRRGVF